MTTGHRYTKILGTLGPASSDADVIRSMLAAGLDGARLNMSHGTHAEHRARVDVLRREAAVLARPLAIVLDLQGPKIRTAGPIAAGELELRAGSSITLVGRSVPATPRRLGIGLRGLPRQVRRRDTILLDDGKLRLRVCRIRGDEVVCEVEVGGTIRERRGVNIPGTRLRLPALTRKDRCDLEFGLDIGVDYVAQSFVSSAADVRTLRRALNRHGVDLPIIAKLERPRALEHLDEILEVAEGVMVARGDLGVEIPVEEVPAAQKHIIARAGERGRLCVTATQMLETMIEKPQPTRAEVSDVANAVFDGTDVVMLSGETAVGRDPVAVVAMMARIVHGAESPPRPTAWRARVHLNRPFKGVLAQAASEAARAIQARALVALTMSGATALRVSKHRPSLPILAVTPRPETLRRAALYWGVVPVLHRFIASSDRLRREVEDRLVRSGHLRPGDVVAYLGGSQPGDVATDFLQLRRLGVDPASGRAAQPKRRAAAKAAARKRR